MWRDRFLKLLAYTRRLEAERGTLRRKLAQVVNTTAQAAD